MFLTFKSLQDPVGISKSQLGEFHKLFEESSKDTTKQLKNNFRPEQDLNSREVSESSIFGEFREWLLCPRDFALQKWPLFSVTKFLECKMRPSGKSFHNQKTKKQF